MKNVAVAVLVFLFTRTLSAQGLYLEHGRSGIGASATYEVNSDLSSYGVSAGYSFSDLFDAGLSASHSVVSSSLAGGGVNGSSIGPAVALYANEGTGIRTALQASYQHAFYSSQAVNGSHVGLKKDFGLFGTTIYGKVPLSPSLTLLPSASVTYTTANANLSDGFESRLLSSDTNPFIIALAAGFLYPAGESTLLQISPALVVNENTTSFLLTVGVVLPREN